jgi:hypothetical protein
MADWRIKGRYYEACNCAHGCPCNFNGFPTHGKCEATVAFAVDEGERDGVDLAGVKVGTAVMWPRAIHDGNGKMAVFIDAASDEQREAIVKIITAEDGGMPWEILATTISDIRGPFFERIEIEDNGTDSKWRVGDKVAVEMETHKNPVTGEPNEVHTVIPNGFLFRDGLACNTKANRASVEDISFDHSGNNAYYSHVEWSNAEVPATVAGTKF